MKVMIVIPSRMASTRFPGKPLADIGGKPMVVRVMEQAQKAGVGDVYVAVSEPEVAAAVEAAGGRTVMTDADLPSGSDRIWQAVQRLMEKGEVRPDIIINVQGDEPLLPPELIADCVAAFGRLPDADVITYSHPIADPADIANPTKVKVVTTEQGRALYFSRSPIPHGAPVMQRHVGFYGYTYAALERYVQAPVCELETVEKLEQLRGVALGLRYYVLSTPHEPIGVDTPADLEAVKKLLGV